LTSVFLTDMCTTTLTISTSLILYLYRDIQKIKWMNEWMKRDQQTSRVTVSLYVCTATLHVSHVTVARLPPGLRCGVFCTPMHFLSSEAMASLKSISGFRTLLYSTFTFRAALWAKWCELATTRPNGCPACFMWPLQKIWPSNHINKFINYSTS
jgi:hypothetical protein